MLIVAHRGFSSAFPENTALAFERAIAAGADLIETDVRLTLEGVPVCWHDEDLARVTGNPIVIAERTLAELKAAVLPRGQSLLSLTEVLALARGKVQVMLDVKIDSEPVRDAILAALAATAMEDGVVYGVRTAEHLRALRARDVRFALLAMPARPERLDEFTGRDVHAARLWEHQVAAATLAEVRARGVQVWVTAGLRARGEDAGQITEPRLRNLLALGVDAVLVNDVELAVRARAGHKAKIGC